MKKIISILALAILVSSCGNHLSIVKRHYTKGFYVENGKKTASPALVKTETKNKPVDKIQPSVISFLTPEKQSKDGFLETETAMINPVHQKQHSFQSQLKKHNSGADQHKFAVKGDTKKTQVIFSEKEGKTAKPAGSSDTNLIILIILCLFPFINLIAMYLHDGKAITLNFWIDLILDLLFFLPGIIFALLVVLDIINLG